MEKKQLEKGSSLVSSISMILFIIAALATTFFVLKMEFDLPLVAVNSITYEPLYAVDVNGKKLVGKEFEEVLKGDYETFFVDGSRFAPYEEEEDKPVPVKKKKKVHKAVKAPQN